MNFDMLPLHYPWVYTIAEARLPPVNMLPPQGTHSPWCRQGDEASWVSWKCVPAGIRYSHGVTMANLRTWRKGCCQQQMSPWNSGSDSWMIAVNTSSCKIAWVPESTYLMDVWKITSIIKAGGGVRGACYINYTHSNQLWSSQQSL